METLQASWYDPSVESFVNLFKADGRFGDVVYAIRVEGHDALRAHSARMKKHNKDLRVEIVTCDATERTGVAEWRLSHEYAGNFDGVDCTGVPITIRGLSLYEFRDG